MRFKQGWCTSNCIQFFKIWAGAQLEPVFGGSSTRFKFFKFCLWWLNLVILPLNDLFNDLAKIKRMFQVTWNQINQNSRLWNLFFLHKNARPILRFYNKTHVFYKKFLKKKLNIWRLINLKTVRFMRFSRQGFIF